MSEHIVETFGIVQEFADLHGDMNTPLYQAIMDVMLSRQREEIVRCKDCEFAAYECKECMRVDEWDDSLWFPVEPDGFCAWGEKAVEE